MAKQWTIGEFRSEREVRERTPGDWPRDSSVATYTDRTERFFRRLVGDSTP